MPIQIQLLSTPAAISGKTIFPKTRGADAPETLPASSSSRWTWIMTLLVVRVP